jgi:alpha-L-fucosidase 2
MKNRTILFALVFVFGGFLMPAKAQQKALRIWFDKPVSLSLPQRVDESAIKVDYSPNKSSQKKERQVEPSKVWENYAFPLGNSNLGVSLLQSAALDKMVLNEKSLWMGGPNVATGAKDYWQMNPDAAPYLSLIRQAFLKGDSLKADSLTRIHFQGKFPFDGEPLDSAHFGCYTTMGEAYVQTDIKDAECHDFQRALSVDDALSTVSFEYDGVHYKRSYFVSYPDQVYIIRYEADHSGKQNLVWSYLPNPRSTGNYQIEPDGLLYQASLKNNGLGYAYRLKVRNQGGNVEIIDNKIIVKNADVVDFYLTAATDYAINTNPDFNDPKTYYGQDGAKIATDRMAKADKWGYEQLLQRHEKDYHQLFDRVTLSLNPQEKIEEKTTEKRLNDYQDDGKDSYLEVLYYQFVRYLMIASSRGESLPSNLQGMWSKNIKGAWNCDYHNNINIQMNYWPVCTANLAECFHPFVRYLQMLEKPGKVTAQRLYHARGWTTNNSSNPFGFTAPMKSSSMAWNLAAINGPWLATHLWDYYDFTRDKSFLANEGYPLLKESADFVADYLWLQPNGIYTAAPSTSPEHGPIDKGSTFANAVARQLLTDAIKASEALNIDEKERKEWQNVLTHLAPYEIGRYGQLMEWSKDIDNPKDNHRHTNHLLGLFPGNTISPITTPALAKAAKIVLEHRGDYSTGWSMGWKLNLWAHLFEGNHAYQLLQNLLSTSTLYNLWDSHPPFQIDGNFGGLSGINEMLLQSDMGFIHLLPALPDAWSEGNVKGLRARGNFTVGISWDFQHSGIVKVTILSGSGGPCIVRYKDATRTLKTVKGKTYKLEFKR